MNWASSEVVGVLTFLLPGFLAATIFYSLTFRPVPGVFYYVIHALIFTMVGQVLTALLFLGGSTADESPGWNNNYGLSDLFVSIVVAVVLALIFVYIMNTDKLHRVLRRIGLTRETSYPSQWYSTFVKHSDCYVILYMDGRRRLYGWPEEWPSDPNRGHFRIIEAEWLVADADGFAPTDISAILRTRDSGGNGEISEHGNDQKAKGVDDGKETAATAPEEAAGAQNRGGRSISKAPDRRETETAAGAAAAEKARLVAGAPGRARYMLVPATQVGMVEFLKIKRSKGQRSRRWQRNRRYRPRNGNRGPNPGPDT